MRQSLRRTLAHLNLAYGSEPAGEGLMGQRFTLDVEGSQMVLTIDLTPSFQARDKACALGAGALLRNHARLRSLQCDDNLVRTRLVRAWRQMQAPQLRMVLDLGTQGRLAYAVRPHLRFTGGVQLEVLRLLEDRAEVVEPVSL